MSTLLSGGADVPEKQVGDIGDAAPPAPAEAKPTVSAASESLEGTAREKDSGSGGTGADNAGVTDDGDATGEAVNGDNS